MSLGHLPFTFLYIFIIAIFFPFASPQSFSSLGECTSFNNCSTVVLSSTIVPSAGLPWSFNWIWHKSVTSDVVIASVAVFSGATAMVITHTNLFPYTYIVSNNPDRGVSSPSSFVSTLTIYDIKESDSLVLGIPGSRSGPCQQPRCTDTTSLGRNIVVTKLVDPSGLGCSVTYKCKNGYEEGLNAAYTGACMPDQKYQSAAKYIDCKPVVCLVTLMMDQIVSLGFDVTSVAFDNDLSHSCAPGYNGNGASIVCQPNKIARVNIDCRPVVCQVDAAKQREGIALVNGSSTTLTYGESLHFVCTKGYRGSGATLTCGADRVATFSDHCSPVVCLVLQSEEEIRLIGTVASVTYGKPLEFKCKSAYQGSGATFLCNADGTVWYSIHCIPAVFRPNYEDNLPTKSPHPSGNALTSPNFGILSSASGFNAWQIFGLVIGGIFGLFLLGFMMFLLYYRRLYSKS